MRITIHVSSAHLAQRSELYLANVVHQSHYQAFADACMEMVTAGRSRAEGTNLAVKSKKLFTFDQKLDSIKVENTWSEHASDLFLKVDKVTQ